MTDTITLPRSELKAALDALEGEAIIYPDGMPEIMADAIKNLSARLAQQEEKPEPVLYLYDFPNPDNPREDIVRDWIAYSLEEVERNYGFNVRPLYLAKQK